MRLQESAVMLSGTAGLSTDFVVHDNDDDILDGIRLLTDDVSDGDDDDDNDVLDRSELEHLTGIWGDNLAKMRETDDEDERPEKRVDFSGNVSVEISKILHAGSKQGNVVLSPLFQLSRDKVWMRDNHILHFVSRDGVLTTPLGRELSDNSIINICYHKDPQSEIDYVITSYSQAGPIEKILEEILVLFSDEENTRKSARIFKFLEEICESEN